MRKVIVCNIMSLDGYYEGPGKDVMALFSYRAGAYPADESFDAYNAERLRAAQTLLLGRTTFEQFREYWPSAGDDPGSSAIEREIAELNNAIDKIVVSDSLGTADLGRWRNTLIVKRAEVHERIAKLRGQAGGDILVFGSRTMWNGLAAAGLVDELHLIIAPVVLEAGTPVFDGLPPISLRLSGIRSWKGSGNVLARYEVRAV